VGTSTTTAYSDTGLSASTSYSYRVQASGPGGLSPYSNTASATTLPPPPTAPSSLTAAAASSSQINLAWTAASGAVTTYLVERCQGTPCTFTQVGTSTTTAYSDTALSASTSYSYRVQASGPGGSSPYSNTASATPPPLRRLPAAAAGSSQLNLAWTAASGAVTTYLVERCQTAACSFAPIATVSGTTYSDTTGLAASTSYTYRVQASGPGGSSPYSNTASATTLPPPPTAPSSLTAAAASSSQINLAWTAASGAVTTY